MSSPELIDATEMADQYKSTFELPEIEMLQEVDVDWILKVCDGRERFWTSVVSIKRDNNIFDTEITAKIDNHLVYSKEYNYGDTIKYKLRNVYSVKEAYFRAGGKSSKYAQGIRYEPGPNRVISTLPHG